MERAPRYGWASSLLEHDAHRQDRPSSFSTPTTARPPSAVGVRALAYRAKRQQTPRLPEGPQQRLFEVFRRS
jgi:hypothetical protein